MIPNVPIPKRMQHLPRDHRGYPVPAMVWRDQNGQPHFTINDETVRYRLLIENRCSICGTALLPLRWFVGGPLSAFHPNGMYLDPPLHRDCMHYAMRVCPYLALPSYTKRIDAGTVRNPEPGRLFLDNTQIPGKPALFVCVAADGQSVRYNPLPLPPYVKPNRPYRAIECWKDGRQLAKPEALRLIKVAISQHVPTSESKTEPKGPDHASQ